MTFHAGRPRPHRAPCVPTTVRHSCARCTRQRLPGLDGRGSMRGLVIDATVLLWRSPDICPMRDTLPTMQRAAT